MKTTKQKLILSLTLAAGLVLTGCSAAETITTTTTAMTTATLAETTTVAEETTAAAPASDETLPTAETLMEANDHQAIARQGSVSYDLFYYAEDGTEYITHYYYQPDAYCVQYSTGLTAVYANGQTFQYDDGTLRYVLDVGADQMPDFLADYSIVALDEDEVIQHIAMENNELLLETQIATHEELYTVRHYFDPETMLFLRAEQYYTDEEGNPILLSAIDNVAYQSQAPQALTAVLAAEALSEPTDGYRTVTIHYNGETFTRRVTKGESMPLFSFLCSYSIYTDEACTQAYSSEQTDYQNDSELWLK